jgi:hypothetical protein
MGLGRLGAQVAIAPYICTRREILQSIEDE